MDKAMPAKQGGLSFSGFLFGAVALILVVITALRLIPIYMENSTIGNVFVAIANDPEMQGAKPSMIRMSFIRRASIENITAIQAEDIEVSNEGGRPVLSASYAVKTPLVGNISLYLDFNPSSDK